MPSDREQEQIRAVLEAIENETPLLERELSVVEVDGADITVTMPGTKFSVTYQKREDSPTLMLTHLARLEHHDAGRVRVSRASFSGSGR